MGSILTWTLPQDMLCLVEKRTKNLGGMEMLMWLSGMMSMMNTLCQALTPKVTPSERRQVGLSPMNKAELCSTYLK